MSLLVNRHRDGVYQGMAATGVSQPTPDAGNTEQGECRNGLTPKNEEQDNRGVEDSFMIHGENE